MAWWTPDGTRVAFTWRPGAAERFELYWRPVDRSAEATPLVESGGPKGSGSWTPDGETLVYHQFEGVGGQADLWTLMRGGEPTPLFETEFNETVPQLSPDGQRVTYVSDQSGEQRVYVRSLSDGEGVAPVSTGGGTQPMWSRDGRELFYRNGDDMLAVEITTEPTFNVGTPRLLFEGPYLSGPGSVVGVPNYDVSLDGQFLMLAPEGDSTDTQTITVVLNWFEELKARVPTGR